MKSLNREETNNTHTDGARGAGIWLEIIERISAIALNEEQTDWLPEDVSQALMAPGCCLACWVAATDHRGGVVDYSDSGFEKERGDSREKFDRTLIESFIKNEVMPSESTLVNSDPALGYFKAAAQAGTAGPFSLTSKIKYGEICYGALSVIIPDAPFGIDAAARLITRMAKTLAFGKHESMMRERCREMDEAINSLWKNYRTTFETTGTATILIDEDTTIVLANSEFERLSGYRKAELEEKRSWTEFIIEEDLEMMKEYHRMRRIDPSAAPRNYSIRFVDRHGKIKDIYMTAGIIPGTQKSIASFLDVTEQKRLESEILRISEDERRTIGNNLHDGLGPHLVGIKFMLNLLKQKLTRYEIPETADIDEINALLDQAITQTRMLVKGLCPVDIDAEGLIFALKEFAAQVETIFGIRCRIVHDDSIVFTDNGVATQVYYIVQEAINNAVKHAKAKSIDIIFNRKIGTITLSIDDDGVGIPRQQVNKKGMGINIMKYRARVINAILDVIKNNRGGTSVICILKN